MNYCNIKKFDVANGEGIRTTLFVSGCRNRCKGCFQPETWSFDYGKPFDGAAEEEIFATMENSSVRGLTLLGGEPMEPENQVGLLPFLREFKRRYPNKDIWLFTGNLYEELTSGVGNHCKSLDITPELLSYVDILACIFTKISKNIRRSKISFSPIIHMILVQNIPHYIRLTKSRRTRTL